jgi:hypothetical protein
VMIMELRLLEGPDSMITKALGLAGLHYVCPIGYYLT